MDWPSVLYFSLLAKAAIHEAVIAIANAKPPKPGHELDQTISPLARRLI